MNFTRFLSIFHFVLIFFSSSQTSRTTKTTKTWWRFASKRSVVWLAKSEAQLLSWAATISRRRHHAYRIQPIRLCTTKDQCNSSIAWRHNNTSTTTILRLHQNHSSIHAFPHIIRKDFSQFNRCIRSTRTFIRFPSIQFFHFPLWMAAWWMAHLSRLTNLSQLRQRDCRLEVQSESWNYWKKLITFSQNILLLSLFQVCSWKRSSDAKFRSTSQAKSTFTNKFTFSLAFATRALQATYTLAQHRSHCT